LRAGLIPLIFSPGILLKKENQRKPLTGPDRTKLKERWSRYRDWKKHLDSLPDQNPVLIPSSRPVGSSGIFSYRLAGLDYEGLSERLFKKRNRTFKRNFVDYQSQLYSILIGSEFLPDQTLSKESGGTELFSTDLKKISRNYSQFNRVLIREGFLDVFSLHQKGEKCRSYGVPREILKKGVERVFLSEKEKQGLIKTIRISSQPDQTDPNLNTVGRYYLSLLQRTKIDSSDLDQLEIELGRFRRLYPRVIRHQQGKLDLKTTPKTGRLDSVYLNAPKEFRRLLRLDGQHRLVEGDVGGCHFHFLLEEMTDPDERKRMEKDLLSPDPYLSMCGNPAGVSREDLKKSSHLFKYANRVTKTFLLSGYEWFKSVPYKEGLFYQHLSKRYPVFCRRMSEKEISHKKHRSEFACAVMKKESKVMVEEVGRRCLTEKLIYLPIHDGFLTLPDQYDRVCQIVTECFKKETGSVPKIKRK
jgi:hypothetical protein